VDTDAVARPTVERRLPVMSKGRGRPASKSRPERMEVLQRRKIWMLPAQETWEGVRCSEET
jgi:hypothetical protein